jgi:hypothetical protein
MMLSLLKLKMVKDLTKDEMEIACIGVQASQFMSGRC